MRCIHSRSICLALGILILGLGVASAQDNSLEYEAAFDPEQFAASADPDQIGMIDGARTQARGSLAVGLAFHFAGPALSLCLRDETSADPRCQLEGAILASRFRADLGVLYGFGRFDVRLNLPFVLHQSTDFSPPSGQDTLGSAGVGGPKLGVRFQIARPGSLDIAADLGVSIPTGGANFIGDDGMVVDPRLLFDLRKGNVAFGVNLGYRFRQEPARFADLYVDDELTWSVAAEYWLMPRKLAVGAAAYGRIGIMNAPADPMDPDAAPGEIGAEERPAEALGSIRYFVTPRIAIDVGGGAGFTSGYGAAPFRVLAGLRWIDQKGKAPLVVSVQISDRDNDGVDDADDECAKVAEDLDGFEDVDGCPDLDNDRDGHDDEDDRCPLVAEDRDGYQDSDGCPDTDNDSDAIADTVDRCPEKAEDFDGIDDGDGCPEDDADSDGVEDALDRCPDAAEDRDGIDDDDGCPDADSDTGGVATPRGVVDADKDGVADADDRCPRSAEDADGVSDEDGCPETDADGDGIADSLDRCATVAEDRDGVQDDDGCAEDDAVATADKDRDGGAGTDKDRDGGAGTDKDRDGGAGTDKDRDGGAGTDKDRVGGAGTDKDRDGGAGTDKDRDGGAGTDKDRVGGAGTDKDRDGGAGTDKDRVGGAGTDKDRDRVAVAPPDKDKDGIPDAADRCPGRAEDKDDIQDDDGCPETDADLDKIADKVDDCPVEAEDRDRIQDDDGCPETDADGDGLKDAADKCPLKAEVFNDNEDDDGCPDAGRSLATVTTDAVLIDEKIFFDLNRARLKTRARPTVNAVASILKAHSDLRIRIEGHADDQGKPGWNQTLSQMRSERVRDYLIEQGIAADRLEIQGFGYDRPAVTGTAEAAREKNRRVEFVIIGGTPPEPPAKP